MPLVVGLGNPGQEYEKTRHNAGFAVADRLVDRHGGGGWQRKFKGDVCEIRSAELSQRVVVLKPRTFMNLSGESVRAAVDFYKIPVTDVVVLHDELDLPLGTLRIKRGGGHGGHNGLRSIHQHLGADYLRIRLGIGKPGGKGDHVVGHVLGGFSKDEKPLVEQMLERAEEALMAVLTQGVDRAMAAFNQRA